jgi:hypothetical protein
MDMDCKNMDIFKLRIHLTEIKKNKKIRKEFTEFSKKVSHHLHYPLICKKGIIFGLNPYSITILIRPGIRHILSPSHLPLFVPVAVGACSFQR